MTSRKLWQDFQVEINARGVPHQRCVKAVLQVGRLQVKKMLAFAAYGAVGMTQVGRLKNAWLGSGYGVRPNLQSRCAKRQRRVVCSLSDPLEDLAGAAKGLTYDEVVSDEEYVVLDRDDVARLLEEIQQSGQDPFKTADDELGDEDGDEGLSQDFLTFAEKRKDEWEENKATASKEGDVQSVAEDSKTRHKREGGANMQYFQDQHVQFMPSWAAKAFENGEHKELFDDASRKWPLSSGQRLHDIIARKKVNVTGGQPAEKVGMDGIVDCTVEDVAEDYDVTVEFVVDAMLHFGVPVPIKPKQSVRNSMTTEEIEQLLQLITSFDAADLRDRYSDCTIEELAENYGLSTTDIIDVCEREGLYICQGTDTRLSTVREDRVLDIILKGADMGQPYPPLLDGLV